MQACATDAVLGARLLLLHRYARLECFLKDAQSTFGFRHLFDYEGYSLTGLKNLLPNAIVSCKLLRDTHGVAVQLFG